MATAAPFAILVSPFDLKLFGSLELRMALDIVDLQMAYDERQIGSFPPIVVVLDDLVVVETSDFHHSMPW